MREVRDRYEIFLKVCETGSFSKAAEALNYTQSGISQMMAGDAWQGGLVLSHTNDSGVNKVILRYSDNSDNSVYNKTDDLT